MKNRIYCTFILAIITVMVCAQTEQPKDSIKGHRETVPEIRQGLHINDRNKQTVLFRTTPDKLQPVTV